jgi:opacity protein-like surface antigen
MYVFKIVRAVIVLVASFTMAGSVKAADVYGGYGYGGYKDQPVYFVPFWQGFYIGANLGGAWSNVDNNRNVVFFDPLQPGATFTNNGISGSGLLGGIHGGYNWQSNSSFVFGIELDIGGMGNDASATFFDPFNPSRALAIHADGGWYGDVTGRLGYSYNNILLYGKGGLALFSGNVKIADAFDGFFKDSGTFTGWTIGAGVEYALNPSWTIKVEYLYFNFGNSHFDCCNGASTARFDSDLTFNTIKIGFNYLINSNPVPVR